MKNKIYLLLVIALFLGSCSSGNMAFSKRKYTKGKYKPERGNYNVAKGEKSEDTKYVVSKDKNLSKQDYKVKSEKNSKKEIRNQKETEVAENNEVQPVKVRNSVDTKPEKSGQDQLLLEDQKVSKTNEPLEVEQQNTNTSSTPEASPAGDIGWILGLIALVLGVLSFIFIIMAFFYPFVIWAGWTALAFAIIAIGLGTASLIIDGNVMGYIGMSFGVATIVVFLFWLLFVILF
ncbi:MAG: hypothetical protein KDC84_10945 [Crocinitomicaceae bacterium]|nr:hypothetical protein [Crocinitomicaceae bacterium]